MRIQPYTHGFRDQAIELMASLQEFERALSSDRAEGGLIAEPHFDYLLGLCEAQQGVTLLAVEDDRLSGFLVVIVESEDAEDAHLRPEARRFGLVTDLFVRSDRRGGGIGAALMAAAETHCRDLGLQVIRVTTLSNNDSAIAFYRRCGYAPYELSLSRSL